MWDRSIFMLIITFLIFFYLAFVQYQSCPAVTVGKIWTRVSFLTSLCHITVTSPVFWFGYAVFHPRKTHSILCLPTKSLTAILKTVWKKWHHLSCTGCRVLVHLVSCHHKRCHRGHWKQESLCFHVNKWGHLVSKCDSWAVHRSGNEWMYKQVASCLLLGWRSGSWDVSQKVLSGNPVFLQTIE